jgi:D-threo-aldose 1-dehydrogenase
MTGFTITDRALPRGGVALSTLGFGGTATGKFEGAGEAEAAATLEAAWTSGLRYYDTAPWYGRGLAELRMGAALRHRPRDAFVLSTKVGRLLAPLPRDAPCAPGEPQFGARFDYSYAGTLRSFEDSLQRLGLARVDLLILHDLSLRWHGKALDARFAEPMDGAQRALIEMRAAGVVRAIGVGVNDVAVCHRCLAAGNFDFFMLAGRLTLLDHRDGVGLLDACQARGVTVLAAAPFNSGILATGATPGAQFFYAAPPSEIAARTVAIAAVCREFGVPMGAAAVQFALGHDAVASVVSSFADPAQLAEVRAWLALSIPAGLWRALREAGLIDWQPRIDADGD